MKKSKHPRRCWCFCGCGCEEPDAEERCPIQPNGLCFSCNRGMHEVIPEGVVSLDDQITLYKSCLEQLEAHKSEKNDYHIGRLEPENEHFNLKIIKGWP